MCTYTASLSEGSHIIATTHQAEAFLVEGQEKNFTCESAGKQLAYIKWFESDRLYTTTLK